MLCMHSGKVHAAADSMRDLRAMGSSCLRNAACLQEFCWNATQYYLQPCRTLPGGSSSTELDGSDVCIGPEANAMLDISGRLSAARSYSYPDFNCSCICDESFPFVLGSLDLLLRANDVPTAKHPNYQYLQPACSPPALRLNGTGGSAVYTTACNSLVDSSIQVAPTEFQTAVCLIDNCNDAKSLSSTFHVTACCWLATYLWLIDDHGAALCRIKQTSSALATRGSGSTLRTLPTRSCARQCGSSCSSILGTR